MQPQSPNPDYDFMLKSQQPAKRGLALPRLPKPLKIGLAVVVGLIVIIVISSVLSGRKNASYQPIIGVLARNQETLRVSGLVQPQLQDPQTQALAATTTSALSSDRTRLISYLAGQKVKVSPVQLAADTNKTTDVSLQTAAQNNNLDSAYADYLKQSLALYANDLQKAYKTAGPNGKKLLKTAYDSTQTLLAAPPLKP